MSSGKVWDFRLAWSKLVWDEADLCNLYLSEKARAEKKMLIEKDMKALAQYNKEVKELERIIAHDSKLNNFMSTKCKETGEFHDKKGTETR